MRLSKTEEQLMQYLWHIEKAFMKDLIDAYPDPKPATTTIATLLKRMTDKKFIGYKLYGNSREYYPLVKKSDYFSKHVNNLIKVFFNDSASQFASFFTKETDLSEAELEELKKIIDTEIQNKKKMIEYLIKSGLCLLTLLLVYKLLLEKEKMHQFNRFYLLFGLALGLIIPLISIRLSSGVSQNFDFSNVMQPLSSSAEIAKVDLDVSVDTNYFWLVALVYGIVAVGLLTNFIKNLLLFKIKISQNKKFKSGQVTIVLIKDKVVPHSFLSYTFFNENDYLENEIDEQIFLHEFTHVRQKHTFDLLFVELLKIVFWFNPVFIFYRKAIQLNHEFLADESVLNSGNNISDYQNLLLRSSASKTFSLASSLNYPMAKMRLKMMVKQTSKQTLFIKKLTLIPIFIALAILFTDEVVADQSSRFAVIQSNSINANDDYFKGGTIEFRDLSGNKLCKKYEEMTESEKRILDAPKPPSEDLLDTWIRSPDYKIFVDFQEKAINDLAKYQHTDFVRYLEYKPENDKHTSITLLTPAWFKEFKFYGGTFDWTSGKEVLRLPPPRVITAERNWRLRDLF